MDKIEKQNIPVFFNDKKEPVAAVMYINRKRCIYLMKEADEDEIIALYEKKDKSIKSNAEKTEENKEPIC